MSIGWVLVAISSLGAAGFIALAVLAPAIATQFVSAAGKFLAWMLSTRVGVGALVGAACLLGGWLYGDHLGSSRVQAAWDAARETAAAEKAKREKEIAEKAKAEERSTIADEVAADKKAINDLRNYVAKLGKDGVCRLSDDELDWLHTH